MSKIHIRKRKMKKIIYLFFVIFLFSSCGPKRDKVERIFEDGVEVVINHFDPYKLKGEPTTFNLEKAFSIDLEREDLAEKGLSDATTFDIDSEGNIYFARSWVKENCIFKFDRSGNFITSFGRKGQGPGEIQFIMYFGIDSRDNIIVSDQVNRRALIFDKEGNCINETRFAPGTFAMFPLENRYYLGFWRYRGEIDPNDEYFPQGFSLYDSNLEEIKVLDTYKYPSPMKKGRRAININEVFIWEISDKNIYIGNEDRGYEILKYDIDGNLLRKVRKEYIPVKVPEELIKKRKEYYEKLNRKVWFPEYWLPYYSFFPDDEGRLYVKTYEAGENPGEFMFDAFNSDGIFIGRKSLNIYSWGEIAVCAKVKRNLLYCLQEKETGYKELIVYRMKWE